MGERRPNEIWDLGIEEGHRRLGRRPAALVSTGVLGGADVMLGLLALSVAAGALHESGLPTGASHVIASLIFGLAFAFITLARSELFTENFLIPTAAVLAKRDAFATLLRMWLLTFAGNLVALTLFAWLFAAEGVLEPATLAAADTLADEVATREAVPSFLSAIVAGAAMTLFTWTVLAADSSAARIMLALLIGFVLLAPKLNHAVVSYGEVILGIFGDAKEASWGDLLRNLGIATAGNVVGGIGFSTATRFFQVSGEEGRQEASSAD